MSTHPPGSISEIDAREAEALSHKSRVDLVGYASIDTLRGLMPPQDWDEEVMRGMSTLIVLGRRMLSGTCWSRHLRNKQLTHGYSLLLLDHAASHLAHWLEDHGAIALPVASLAFDFIRTRPEGVTPGGQGSSLLRHGAVAAGLGTFGLNMMVLTPQFGPRLHFAGILTDWKGPAAQPMQDELCLGLERCGRCAAVCPQDAIPRSAQQGSALAAYRGLDVHACARGSQPFGYQVFQEMAADVASSATDELLWEGIYNRTASEIYNEITAVKEGVITGCSACMEVCPVGEDYAHISQSPHRQRDLPDTLEHTSQHGRVEVAHHGPHEKPRITWAGWLTRRRSKKG
jgi:epoxyqueuosine reductase